MKARVCPPVPWTGGDSGLSEEAVQYRSVVPIVIEAVDGALVQLCLLRLRVSHDALIEVGDLQPGVLL